MSRRRRRIRLRRSALLVGVIFVSYLYYHPLRSYLDTKHELVQRQGEVEALTEQKQKLEQELRVAGTPEALARAARMQLSLVRPGERLFIVKGIEEWRRRH